MHDFKLISLGIKTKYNWYRNDYKRKCDWKKKIIQQGARRLWDYKTFFSFPHIHTLIDTHKQTHTHKQTQTFQTIQTLTPFRLLLCKNRDESGVNFSVWMWDRITPTTCTKKKKKKLKRKEKEKNIWKKTAYQFFFSLAVLLWNWWKKICKIIYIGVVCVKVVNM